jgi:hypothetical protein
MLLRPMMMMMQQAKMSWHQLLELLQQEVVSQQNFCSRT